MTNMDFFGKMDPYCKFLIGNVMRRTPTVLKGGTDPYFAEAECEFWIGDTNWNKPLVFTVYETPALDVLADVLAAVAPQRAAGHIIGAM